MSCFTHNTDINVRTWKLLVINQWTIHANSFLLQTQQYPPFLANRPYVCLSSVTLVHPTQAVQIFRNISAAFGTLAIR